MRDVILGISCLVIVAFLLFIIMHIQNLEKECSNKGGSLVQSTVGLVCIPE